MEKTDGSLPRVVVHPTFRSIHSYPFEGKNCRGHMYDIKVFPPSNPGRAGFSDPGGPPTSGKFKDWFQYYVKLTGYHVECLNAYQFNLDGVDIAAVRGQFIEHLEVLVRAMCIGKSHNPAKLIWPLNGVYVCDLQNTTGFKAVLVTSFECDPDYQLVTNCSVQLIQPVKAPEYVINNVSSSSSSLATSSSGAITE